MSVRAVLFDWGGTLSRHVDVDLLQMWRAAALVLAPQDPEPVAAALLAAELDWWRTSVEAGDRSGTTEQLVRSVATETHLDVEGALAAYHGSWSLTVEHDPAAGEVLAGLGARGIRTGLLSNTHWPRALHDRWLAEAVFVGDRPRDDVSGAQGVGMRAVLMTGRPVEAWPVVPDAELVTLDGLLELVDAWS